MQTENLGARSFTNHGARVWSLLRFSPSNFFSFFFFSSPTLHVTDGFCRKFGNPGDSSPSGFLYTFSSSLLSLSLSLSFGSGPPFPGSKKKSRSFLPRATWYFVVSFFFFFFFWTFTTPRLLIFHPSIRTPLYDGPCPASGNVRFFLSFSLRSSTYGSLYQFHPRRDGGWTIEKKKFIENLPNRRRIVTMEMWRGRSNGFSTWKTVGRMVIRFLLKGGGGNLFSNGRLRRKIVDTFPRRVYFWE